MAGRVTRPVSQKDLRDCFPRELYKQMGKSVGHFFQLHVTRKMWHSTGINLLAGSEANAPTATTTCFPARGRTDQLQSYIAHMDAADRNRSHLPVAATIWRYGCAASAGVETDLLIRAAQSRVSCSILSTALRRIKPSERVLT
uniref:Uncharacterized protein n=1 Tax=Peronospora matthiolae TaxID=2874970 RepID=A0AAV1VG09_9STRA